MLSLEKVEFFCTILNQQLADILSTLQNLETRAGPVELDQSSVGRLSRVDAMQQQAMALGTIERMKREQIRIEAALTRIHANKYGRCCRCQLDMDETALRTDPAAPFCLDCRQEMAAERSR